MSPLSSALDFVFVSWAPLLTQNHSSLAVAGHSESVSSWIAIHELS